MFTLSINGLKYNIFYSRIFRHSFCFNDLVILYIENISDAIYLSEKCVGNFLSIDVAIKDRMNIGNVIEGFVQMNCNIAISSVDYLDYINDQLKDIYSNEECGLSSILKGKNYHILLLEGLLKENHDATPYNQFMLDVLFLWYYNLNVKWKNVNSSHFKQAYIRATYFYNCGSTILNVNHDVTIDGNYIKDEWDIFYYLGEFMLGAKGFIGLGLESMYDNLINVSSICNLSQVVVKFSSFDKISGVVGPEYLDRLIEILKEYEIQVEIV